MNGREPFPELTLRPLTAADDEAVVTAFRRLSPGSIYRRFFTGLADPAPMARRLVAQVDHEDHEVLVVLDGNDIVAMGQWDRHRPGARGAEIAVVVDDGHQGYGLGRSLVGAVAADAHRHHVDQLTATVLTDNGPARRLAKAYGPTESVLDGAETHYAFALAGE